jgi:hypothetical protein
MSVRLTWVEFDTAVTTGNYIAATEIGSDSASFSGSVASSGVSGSLSATESGNDSASFFGDVYVFGSLSVSESGADTAVLIGSGATPPATGSFDILESGSDSISLSGKIIVAGVLTVSEAGSDSASFSGNVSLPVVTGTLSASESGSDTASVTNVEPVMTLTAADLAAIDALILARAADIAAAVWANDDGRFVARFGRNKFITDPSTGIATLYDDDGVTVLAQGQLYEDAAGSVPYRGRGAERRERLA